jgi:hypothetical protein
MSSASRQFMKVTNCIALDSYRQNKGQLWGLTLQRWQEQKTVLNSWHFISKFFFCASVFFLFSNSLTAAEPEKKFEMGIEYITGSMNSLLAKKYKETGVKLVKPFSGTLIWSCIEQSPDVYNFNASCSRADGYINEWNNLGFDVQHVLISSEPPAWFTEDYVRTHPTFNAEAQFRKFVRTAVQRYPKVVTWGVEQEFTAYFKRAFDIPYNPPLNNLNLIPDNGGSEQYFKVLKIVSEEVRKVFQERKQTPPRIAAIGFLLIDLFEGKRSLSEVPLSCANAYQDTNPKKLGRYPLTEICEVLDDIAYYEQTSGKKLVDVIDFHALADYTEIPVTVAWLKKELSARGLKKDIVAGDAFPMSIMMGWGIDQEYPAGDWRHGVCKDPDIFIVGQTSTRMIYPLVESYRSAACDAMTLIRAKDKPAAAWLEKNTAVSLIRKYVTGANELKNGFIGFNMGNLTDWPGAMKGLSEFFGMVDVTDYIWNMPVTNGERPVFYVMKMIFSRLTGFKSVAQIFPQVPLNTDSPEIAAMKKNMRLYEFTMTTGDPLYVGWYDDGKVYGLTFNSAPPPAIDVPITWLYTHSLKYTVIPTKRGEPAGGTVKCSKPSGGIMHLQLGEVPSLIEVVTSCTGAPATVSKTSLTSKTSKTAAKPKLRPSSLGKAKLKR